MTLTAVGFDLDATLATTTRSREQLLAEACERVGAPDLSREAYLLAHAEHAGSQTREPVFAALLEEHDTTVDPTRLARAYREAIERALEPVPGAESLVRELRRSYRVGLLTDGPDHAQRSKLTRLGWTDLFDAVVVTGTLEAPKPDPVAFETLCRELGVPAAETAYVGNDTENDVAGAASAGLRPVQVLYDGGPERHPAAAAVVRRDALVAELPDLLADL